MLTMFPGERPEYPDVQDDGDRAVISLSYGGKFTTAVCRLHINGKAFTGSARFLSSESTDKLLRDRLCQRVVKLSFYRAALASGVPAPAWGALTGIRPGKLISNFLDEGLSPRRAVSEFMRQYDVSRERAELCLDAAKGDAKVRSLLDKNDICLYVGIPFCPTRCAYCSFVSNSVEKSTKLIEPFMDALMRDIDATAETIADIGLRPRSLYIGGGTPTTLTPEQLDRMCARLCQAFDLSGLLEYTVEAGRPDTITREKLCVLKSHGVTRISVNPQTLDDRVLEAIGRRHTAGDVLDAMELVRDIGGFKINMDLIAGLTADSPEGFRRTLDTVLKLRPENITVHTLALKKGSRIMLEGTSLPGARDVGRMLDYAVSALRSSGYGPYYLYRQKFMSGGFENVGWSLPGAYNLYNICIMEELCSIISMGGGASTKLVSPSGRIERVFAPKYPLEYIERSDKVISDKIRIKEFYNGV